MNRILITKPRMRWLFGGVGFHNSEATMTALMSDDFLKQIAVKTFREISPTFSRLFAGYADWTKEAMDAFADYYDKTFKNAKTLLYVVPGRMPMIMDDFNIEEYCENVAQNLNYLINIRKCTKVRYYCATNELSCGNTYAYLAERLELFKKIQEELYKAFKRYNLDIGLLSTDCSGVVNFHQIKWAADNMDEVTENYCAHLYCDEFVPGSLEAYDYFCNVFCEPVSVARDKEKRFILGEYGIINKDKWMVDLPMGNDVAYSVDFPESEGKHAISLAEMAMAAINSGCFAAAYWSMIDYPDPFIRESGDTDEEKKIYEAARFSGHGISYRYNKNGLIKWCDDEKDYGSRASLYTMGYMAKLFRKGSRVLKSEWKNEKLRCCAVTNADGTVSIAIINWEDARKNITIELEHNCDKPLRKYVFEANNIPYNKFNDLQKYSGTISSENEFNVELPPISIVFLTTDYIDRAPSKIKGLKLSGGKLTWNKCEDEEHCYYRVYCDEKQIASTVAEYVTAEEQGRYKVYSVDKYGNCLI